MGKNVDNLDDVAKLLSKKSVQKIILKKRNQSQRILRKKRNKREHNEDRKIMIIPALIIVLILVIKFLEALGLGVPLTNKNKIAVSSSEMASASDMHEDQDTSLKEYNDDVLEKFFREYFQAKLTADVDTLYRLSGVSNQSEEQQSKLKAQLKTQAGYIESYDDIKTYAVPGIGENEKLVFLQYKVRFRRAKTAAPAIMYCYIKVNEDNAFELVENKTPEQTKFVYDYIQTHQEVKDLINAVDSQLLEALSSDSRLAVLYDAFQTGRIYKEDQASIDSEVSLIEMDENGPTVSETEGSGNKSSALASGESTELNSTESADAGSAETSTETSFTESSRGN